MYRAAGYTYLDSELVDDGTGLNDGKQVQNVAKNSATLWTTYQVMPQLTLGAGAIAMDKVYANAANTKWVPGYVRYDAMARYNVNKNVDLQLKSTTWLIHVISLKLTHLTMQLKLKVVAQYCL